MSGEKSSSQMAFHEPPLLSPKLPLSKGPIPLLPAPVPSSARSGDGWQPDKTDGFIVGASWVTFVTILGTSLSLNAQSPCPQAHPAVSSLFFAFSCLVPSRAFHGAIVKASKYSSFLHQWDCTAFWCPHISSQSLFASILYHVIIPSGMALSSEDRLHDHMSGAFTLPVPRFRLSGRPEARQSVHGL
ncbi:hypothetical protein P154DRAFT_575171 [Amniculicola lignicola CBS 123094]|uniref:Uncharacterized protein n=1 Tax=Amniculicola lignicola CBS 123094 TaxID=1392246 RepID=A0A6A5WMP7_9PLEO|nr:hypothetical protein P154DRAFT_575171 [Amniculicola lignicola CBS 123094]